MKRFLFFPFFCVGSLILADGSEADQLRDGKFWGLENIFSLSPNDIAKNLIKEFYSAPVPDEDIQIQQNSELSVQEKKYLENRAEKVASVLQDRFGIEKPIRLGFCCSGGGNRAMIGSLGILKSAAKSGLFDASTYVAALSGSTWLLSELSYLSAISGNRLQTAEILDQIKSDYKSRLDGISMVGAGGFYAPPLLSLESTDDLFLDIAKRFADNQEMTLVNIFGALVADYALGLLGCDRLSEKWSSISERAESGDFPLPLCSSIFEGKDYERTNNYEWFEMSPLQCGSKVLGYLPVKYLGSGFNNGMLDKNRVKYEHPISFFLGMYGSAFSATVQDIGEFKKNMKKYETLIQEEVLAQLKKRGIMDNSFIRSFIYDIINEIISSRSDLTFAHFLNYSQGMEGSLLKEEPFFGMFDAGIDINIPVPALVDRTERNVDLVIMYDSNPGLTDEIFKIAEYCQFKNIPFPSVEGLTSEQLQAAEMTILNDPREQNYLVAVPTYIYIPTNWVDVTSPPYNSFNFKYSDEEIDLLSGRTEDVLTRNTPEISEIMKLLAYKRYA